jgi:uncharacterized phage protein (TIGR01671 family)
MLRAIKFRVWDKLAKVYILPDVGYQGHYIMSLNGQFHNLQNGSGGDEYIVQQFTGLNDKDGKEIYAGDVLYFDNKTMQATLKVKEKQDHNGYGFICYGKNENDLWAFPYYKDIKIIGNIFDNPELVIDKQ